jgi:hypothetical protein
MGQPPSLAHLDSRTELTSLIRIFYIDIEGYTLLSLPLLPPNKDRDGILGHQFVKESSLLLHPIHSLSTGGFLKKKISLYSGFKNTYKKSTKQEYSSLNVNRIL